MNSSTRTTPATFGTYLWLGVFMIGVALVMGYANFTRRNVDSVGVLLTALLFIFGWYFVWLGRVVRRG